MATKPYSDESWLRDRWFSDRSLANIADEADVSKQTIKYWARKFDLPHFNACHSWNNEETLRELYIERGLTIDEIADEVSATYATVQKWLDHFDIQRRHASDYDSHYRGRYEPWYDERILRTLYVDQRLSLSTVAGELGCSVRTVAVWLEKHGIETRGYDSKYDQETPWRDGELLRRLYHDEGLSQKQIADQLGCDQAVIVDWMSRFDITPRGRSEALVISYGNAGHPLRDPERLRELYIDKELSIQEIADRSDPPVTETAIFHWLHEFGIETRPPATELVYENPLDREYVYYGPNWESQRARRVQRDDYECVLCGMSRDAHREEHGTDLHVHHLTPIRRFRGDDGHIDYEKANRLENLLTVCRGCHIRWEGVPLRPQ